VPDRCIQPAHLFYMILPSPESRTALIAHLREAGILSVFHFQPLHLSAKGRELGGQPGDCPVTEWAADRLLRLPLFTALTGEEQTRVIDAVRQFRC